MSFPIRRPGICLLAATVFPPLLFLMTPAGLHFGSAPTVHAHSLHGSRTSEPPEDYTLTIYAIGAWSGKFDVGPEGRGGLAALHTIVENKRRQARVGDRGGVLLVQSGNFTGATTAELLRKKIKYPGVNLARYLRLDALGPTADETLWYAGLKQNREPGFESIPAVSFNFRSAVQSDRDRPVQRSKIVREKNPQTVRPFRLLRRSGYTALITAVTSGSEPKFGTDPINLLAGEFQRQNGADLYMLLLDRRPDNRPEPVVDSHNLHDTPVQQKRAEYLNSIDLLARRKFWQSFFPASPGATPDPYALPDHKLAQQWLIIESSAAKNHFMRLPEGPYLCSIAGHMVCEITVEFRKHRVRGVRARFIELNGARTPGGWIVPDPILLEVLKKQT